MMQPEAWKEIGTTVQNIWNVAGPVVGLYIGARLSRSSDRRKWLSDNRATECKEVLKIMATTIHLMFEAQHRLEINLPDIKESERVKETYNESLNVLQYRLFIADDVRKHQIRERWVKLVREYNTTHDHKTCQREYETLQQVIVKMALDSSPKLER
jgi:hypothetical protein